MSRHPKWQGPHARAIARVRLAEFGRVVIISEWEAFTSADDFRARLVPEVSTPMFRLAPLDQRDLRVATQFHGLLVLAHAQESARLRIRNFVALQRTAEDIRDGAELHLGAFSGEVLVGVVSLSPDEEEPGQISVATLVVHPQHQRQGIARTLMREALRRGEGEVFSVCTGAANEPALALYKALGFVAYRRGTIGPEALALVKLRRPVRSS